MTYNLTGKVKPCPLCGSSRIYADFPKYDFIYTQNICCADCGLKGFKNFTEDVSIDEALNRVIDYWNSRVITTRVKYPNFPEPTDNEKEFQESALGVVAEYNFNLPYYRTFMFIDGVRYRLTIQREDNARGKADETDN